ncbi:glycine cleavage system protein GcvH [Atopomonas sediminilitoris]|uniref:glycine cleavage system protein GcvH n=1 Tax=Atopomonas sediminilitoris TaxID=2919919 RepID=UPI001F4DF2EA|nr:glycine cleavage system protein GcvH [Atopomonas sediminilitoris]MCJ8168440.1 glycine cleavage system protein GcvH [Atopomonas sediminilitoris]
MSELRFTVDHEWLRVDQDGLITVGVTHFAQDALGDVVFVQLPEAGDYEQGAEVAVLESVKAASSIVMPMAGEVIAVNATLEETPELVNQAPLTEGWFFRMRAADMSAFDSLMDESAYARFLTATADA